VSRVRENRMHGSMGGGRKPATVGHAARRQAPLAYPTNLGTLAAGLKPKVRPQLDRHREQRPSFP